MKLLDLFSGTGSIGSVAKELGYEVILLDEAMEADIKCNILDWGYKIYPHKYFDVIWASPPCTEYSIAKTTGVRDIEEANKIVQRTLDILEYYEPKYWIIESPQTGMLKNQVCMDYHLKILIIVNMECHIGKEQDYGMIYLIGILDHYVKEIVGQRMKLKLNIKQ